jgi:cytochrome c-type biogenesis protein CcmH
MRLLRRVLLSAAMLAICSAQLPAQQAASSSPQATAQLPPASPSPSPSPTPAPGDDPALDARARAVAAVLRCPVCQGESIMDSPAELAQQMRAVVYDQLHAGRTPDEIKAYFVASYGEWILLKPAMTGLNIALYVVPVLLLAGGLVFVVVLVRRWAPPSKLAE